MAKGHAGMRWKGTENFASSYAWVQEKAVNLEVQPLRACRSKEALPRSPRMSGTRLF